MKRTNNKGFTFIELVLYIGILSVFMVAVTTLIGTVVSSNRKMTARKKIQNQATEAYDTISDLLMTATDVQIVGTANIKQDDGTVTSVSGAFIVPPSGATKNVSVTDEETYMTLSLPSSLTMPEGVDVYYDIADLVSYSTDSSTVSDDTVIEPYDDGTDETDKEKRPLYLKVKYAAGIYNEDTGDKKKDDSKIVTACLAYKDGKIYLSRDGSSDTFVDASTAGEVLCKDVETFKLQVNTEDNSFAITLGLSDATTAASYEVNGVVNIRNTNVLQASK